MAKIHIVGAGPSGSIAAISALQNNHSVIMSEDHPVSGTPENCSGLFSADGLNSLSNFLNYRKFIHRRIYGADIHIGGEKLQIRRKEPVGFVCDRSGLDQELSGNAQKEGAKINYHERVTNNFHSTNIIGADGPLSTVARHFGFPKIKDYAATFQSVVDYQAENPDIVEVFLSTHFHGFFGWIIPHDEYSAEFGVGVKFPAHPRNAWNHLFKIKNLQVPRPKGAVIPISTRSKTAAKKGKNNVLLVGDAAGQVKATTGGGVIFGGNCAAIAGKHPTNPIAYELEWRTRFGPDLAIHSIVHNYLASCSESQFTAIGRRLKKLNLDDYLSTYGHMDRPTKMIGPGMILHMIKNGVA